MSEPLPNPFDNRVSEARVAAVLACIAAPPGPRGQPRSADADGGFDFWFNGGACKHNTDSAHHQVTDGTIAMGDSPAAWLLVKVAFGHGTHVNVFEEQRPA